MKSFILAFAVMLIITACNSKPNTNPNLTTTDTTGNYLRRLADTSVIVQTEPIGDTIITSDGEQYVKLNPDGTTTAAASNSTAKSTTTKKRSSTTSNRSTANNSQGSGSSTGSGTSTSSTQTQPEEKKGWSNAAKGAAIGGASGAVTGAIISKKKGKGAIIGGVVGAAGGYVIGRSKDKKENKTNN